MCMEHYMLLAIYSSSTIGALFVLYLLRCGLPWFVK